MCLDFDHVTEPEALKQKLINHEYFDTELMFTSPSGDGVKWIISIDLKNWEHSRRLPIAFMLQDCRLSIVLEVMLHAHVFYRMTHKHT